MVIWRFYLCVGLEVPFSPGFFGQSSNQIWFSKLQEAENLVNLRGFGLGSPIFWPLVGLRLLGAKVVTNKCWSEKSWPERDFSDQHLLVTTFPTCCVTCCESLWLEPFGLNILVLNKVLVWPGTAWHTRFRRWFRKVSFLRGENVDQHTNIEFKTIVWSTLSLKMACGIKKQQVFQCVIFVLVKKQPEN